MSKFYYRGTPDVMENYGKAGYKPKPQVKLGTQQNPVSLIVTSQQRKDEIMAIMAEHTIIGDVELDEAAAENIIELEAVLNKPKTQRFEKTPERNDPCSCGSGKKYKKCCG